MPPNHLHPEPFGLGGQVGSACGGPPQGEFPEKSVGGWMAGVGVGTPLAASANEELARAEVGLWGSPQRPEGAGPRPFFGAPQSEGRRRQGVAAGRRWKPSWALCAEPRGLLLSTGEVCVRLPLTSSPEGTVVGPAPLVQMPFRDPLSRRGRHRCLGVRSGVTWLLGQQG